MFKELWIGAHSSRIVGVRLLKLYNIRGLIDNNMNINKLEAPWRVKELNPSDTLRRVGVNENSILCDIGAGTGLFSIPAAFITTNNVFAIDIEQELVDFLRRKAEKESLTNLVSILAKGFNYNIDDKIVDFVIMVTVFHEILEKDTLLKEINRILSVNGKVVIIEFHKKETPFGPPLFHRIGKDEVISFCEAHGFYKNIEFNLGANFYCIVFNK